MNYHTFSKQLSVWHKFWSHNSPYQFKYDLYLTGIILSIVTILKQRDSYSQNHCKVRTVTTRHFTKECIKHGSPIIMSIHPFRPVQRCLRLVKAAPAWTVALVTITWTPTGFSANVHQNGPVTSVTLVSDLTVSFHYWCREGKLVCTSRYFLFKNETGSRILANDNCPFAFSL